MTPITPIIAIDPGPTESACVEFDGSTIVAQKLPNDQLMAYLQQQGEECRATWLLAVEMIASYGMAVGAEVFETCVWIGRYLQAWNGQSIRVKRLDVKLHLCHDSRAKDANIRQALIDRFGAPGTKKAPGLTYGISGDMWAALGVAVTAGDMQRAAH